MVTIDEVLAKWNRAVAEVADIAKVPVDRRKEFDRRLTGWHDAADEWERHEMLAFRDALSPMERGAIEKARHKMVAAYNAFLALTPAARALVAANGPGDQIEMGERLVAALSGAADRPSPGVIGAQGGRPKGRTQEGWIAHQLLEMVEGCGGELPSIDHDPDRSTIN
jgi:hypothetical protein